MPIRFSEDYYLRVLFHKFKVGDLMSSSFVTISDFESLERAQELFVRTGAYHLVVVDDDNLLVGMISKKYLYRTRSPRKVLAGENFHETEGRIMDGDCIYERETLASYGLNEVMNKFPATLQKEDSAAKAVDTLVRSGVDCMAIVDGHYRVEGILYEKHLTRLIWNVINE